MGMAYSKSCDLPIPAQPAAEARPLYAMRGAPSNADRLFDGHRDHVTGFLDAKCVD